MVSFLSQESLVQDALVKQLAQSASTPVFPGFAGLPMFAGSHLPQLPQMPGVKERSEPQDDDNQNSSNYVQHLQSTILFKVFVQAFYFKIKKLLSEAVFS